jgi:hypothetical protein
MEKNKVAGPDGIPTKFYNDCWEIITDELVVLFCDLYLGKFELTRLNYGIKTLIPKKKGADNLK